MINIASIKDTRYKNNFWYSSLYLLCFLVDDRSFSGSKWSLSCSLLFLPRSRLARSLLWYAILSLLFLQNVQEWWKKTYERSLSIMARSACSTRSLQPAEPKEPKPINTPPHCICILDCKIGYHCGPKVQFQFETIKILIFCSPIAPIRYRAATVLVCPTIRVTRKPAETDGLPINPFS